MQTILLAVLIMAIIQTILIIGLFYICWLMFKCHNWHEVDHLHLVSFLKYKFPEAFESREDSNE